MNRQRRHENTGFYQKGFTLPYELPSYQHKIRPILQSMEMGSLKDYDIKLALKELEVILKRDNTYTDNQQKNNYRDTRDKRDQVTRKNSPVDITALEKLVSPALFYKPIAKYILHCQQTDAYKSLPILRSSQTTIEHTYQKRHIYLLLCLMCTFLIPPSNSKFSNHQILDFSAIFKYQTYKTQCITEYMRKQSIESINKQENMKVKRVVVRENLQQLINKKGYQKKMGGITIRSDKDDIEDMVKMAKVDFANQKLGGGAFGNGCVQEEIMIANRPELYPILILSEKIRDNEAIILTGFRKYFKNKGYSDTTRYDGLQTNTNHLDTIIAMDATYFSRSDPYTQFTAISINRQILKAYAGFLSNDLSNQIATGNWGCGAFNGNHQLKFLIQWIAASMADKKLHICPYGKKTLLDDDLLLCQLRKKTVKETYEMVIVAGREVGKGEGIYDVLKRMIGIRVRGSSRDSRHQHHKFEKDHNYTRPTKISQTNVDKFTHTNRHKSVNSYQPTKAPLLNDIFNGIGQVDRFKIPAKGCYNYKL